MEKRILLGSIVAVVILVLVSFTGVVGYQTTSSTIARASPLFNVRSKRAIGQGQRDITADYLGHGEETNIHFSSRIRRAEQAQKAIDIISKMSDKTFSKYVTRINLHLKNQEKMIDIETSDMLQALYYIRENPNVMGYYDEENSPIPETSEYYSCRWKLVCYVLNILNLALVVTVVMLIIVLRPLTIDFFTCSPYHPVCQTADCAI